MLSANKLTETTRKNFKIKLYIGVVFGVIGFISAGITTYLNPTGNTSTEILAVEKRLQAITDEIGKPAKESKIKLDVPDPFRLAAPSMGEVLEAVKSLTIGNQRIAIAKVMMKSEVDMSSEKKPWYAPQWEDRYIDGNKPWLVQEKRQLIGTSLLMGLASFAAVSVLSLIVIFVMPWFWYFLLERIKELSAAIKGN